MGSWATLTGVDPMKAESIRFESQGSAGRRLLQALDAMRDGFAVKRANLRRQYPSDSDEQIEARLVAWMASG